MAYAVNTTGSPQEPSRVDFKHTATGSCPVNVSFMVSSPLPPYECRSGRISETATGILCIPLSRPFSACATCVFAIASRLSASFLHFNISSESLREAIGELPPTHQVWWQSIFSRLTPIPVHAAPLYPMPRLRVRATAVAAGFAAIGFALRIKGIMDHAVYYCRIVLTQPDEQPAHRQFSIVQMHLTAGTDVHGRCPRPTKCRHQSPHRLTINSGAG